MSARLLFWNLNYTVDYNQNKNINKYEYKTIFKANIILILNKIIWPLSPIQQFMLTIEYLFCYCILHNSLEHVSMSTWDEQIFAITHKKPDKINHVFEYILSKLR